MIPSDIPLLQGREKTFYRKGQHTQLLFLSEVYSVIIGSGGTTKEKSMLKSLGNWFIHQD